jgi:hypothetical protein
MSLIHKSIGSEFIPHSQAKYGVQTKCLFSHSPATLTFHISMLLSSYSESSFFCGEMFVDGFLAFATTVTSSR